MIEMTDIHALADGELSPEDAARVEAQVNQCPQSLAEYKACVALKSATRRLCDAVTCEETWNRCKARLGEIDRTQRVESFVGRWAWGFCSVFLALILGAGMLNRGAGNPLHSTDVARMMSSLGTSPSTAPAAPEQMRNWLRGFAPGTIQLDHVRVVAAADGVIDNRRVARLTLQDAQGFSNLLIIPNADGIVDLKGDGAPEGYCYGRVGQLPCVAWTESGFAFIVVANRSPQDLLGIAQGIRVH